VHDYTDVKSNLSIVPVGIVVTLALLFAKEAATKHLHIAEDIEAIGAIGSSGPLIWHRDSNGLLKLNCVK